MRQSTLHHYPPHPDRPSLRRLLVAHFADGFGATFHSLLISLYALESAGLAGFSGLVSSGMLGAAAATMLASTAATRWSGRRIMRSCATIQAVSRLGSYLLLLTGVGVLPLAALRFTGSVGGAVITNLAKTQTGDEQTATRLAWQNVSSGSGRTAAATAAAVFTMYAPVGAIVIAGSGVGVAATVPMFLLANTATTTRITFQKQITALRMVAGPAALGAALHLMIGGLLALRDGVVSDLHGVGWLGPVTAAALGGSVVAAAVLRRWPHVAEGYVGVRWPLVTAVGAAAWAGSGAHPTLAIGAVVTMAFADQVLAAGVEARILATVGAANGGPALIATGSLGAFAGAVSAPVTTGVIERADVATASVGAALGCLLVGATAVGVALLRRARASAGDRIIRQPGGEPGPPEPSGEPVLTA